MASVSLAGIACRRADYRFAVREQSQKNERKRESNFLPYASLLRNFLRGIFEDFSNPSPAFRGRKAAARVTATIGGKPSGIKIALRPFSGSVN
jgi:hypothetical protein